MKFIADEGVDRQIVDRLRKDGYDITYIAEFDVGAVDPAILELANNEKRILITRDKDFGELAYRNRLVHAGIILNRLFELTSAKKAEIVSNVVQQYGAELENSFTVIQPGRVRIRKMD